MKLTMKIKTNAVIVLSLFVCSAFSSPALQSSAHKSHTQDVNIVAMPPVRPTEVKIVSVPPTYPTEVKILSAPRDDSADAMVFWTKWILIANAVLCLVTFVIGITQRNDNKKSIAISARAAAAAHTSADAAKDSVEVTKQLQTAQMVRDINRAAHKVMVTAERLKPIARDVPKVRNRLYVLTGQGGMPTQIKVETEAALLERIGEFEKMIATASANTIMFSNLLLLSEKELAERIWALDAQQIRLEAMQDSIAYELNKDEAEIQINRQQNTAMQAAALNARMTPTQPKTRLGD